MTSVGHLLRSAREQQNRGLGEIAEDLCIMQAYLRAIEADDVESLPGAFFYKSFVKQYASLLGVEQQLIQPGVDALCSPFEDSSPPAVAPALVPDPPRAPWRPWLSESLHILRHTKSADTPPLRSSSVREPDPMVRDFNRYFSDRRIGVSVAGLAVALLASSGFYAWWTKAPAAEDQVVTAPPVSPPVAPSVASVLQTIPVAGDAGVVNHAALDLSATETTWLSITVDGRLIFSGVLEPQQTKTITGVEGAKMKVGNAGGLEVRWKGKSVGPIGPRGQVRTVLIKTDDVEILKPVPEASTL